MIKRFDPTPDTPEATAWLAWRPNWPIVRWMALAAAVVCIFIARLACIKPLLSKSNHLHIIVENPLKALLAAAAFLEIWCLFSPRVHSATARMFSTSLWRIMAFVGSLEAGTLAVIGIVSIDLRWKSAPIWSSQTPTQSATVSFLLLAVALSKTDPRWQFQMFLGRFLVQWKSWNWRSRVVLTLLGVNVLIIGWSLLTYWRHASTIFSYHDETAANVVDDNKHAIPNFDNFCRRCREQIPPNARVLYRGPNEGLVLAYELYPRRVFMMPQDQRDMFHECWWRESWCKGMAADPLEHYWKWDLPRYAVPQEQFISEHQITYLVTFDEFDVAKNVIQVLR